MPSISMLRPARPWIAAAAGLLLVVPLSGSGLLSPAGAASSTLVSAWGPSLNQGGQAFSNQTIRQVVHLSAGGNAVTVRLSNRLGSSSVTAAHVDLAVQSSGASAKAGTHHTVTFGQARSVSLAKGAEKVSDPLAMTVASGDNLLLSIYLSNSVATSTRHPSAIATTYLSTAGDHASEDGAAHFPTHSGSWFFADGVRVSSPTATGTLVAFGDSITEGAKSTTNANRRYPDDLARRLAAEPGGPKLSVVNAGIGANRVLVDGSATSGLSALHRFSHDALGQPKVRAVILLQGINDTLYNSKVTSAQVISGYQTLIGQAHAAGVKIYAGTLTPFGGHVQYSAVGESYRQSLNTWIRTSGAFDGVIDYDRAVRDPADAHRLRPAYDSGDHIHPNDVGYQAMADAVNLPMLP